MTRLDILSCCFELRDGSLHLLLGGLSKGSTCLQLRLQPNTICLCLGPDSLRLSRSAPRLHCLRSRYEKV